MINHYSNFSSSKTQLLSNSQRVEWVDYAKGIGIFLVVLGHTIRGLFNSSILDSSTTVSAIDKWIYSFHMPLFFFISGLFIYRSTSKPLPDFLLKKLKVIVYPYILWSLVQSIFQAIASNYTNSQVVLVEIWKIVYAPVMQFWFLYALFLIVLIYAVARKLGISNIGFLIFSILLYATQMLELNLGWGILYQVRNYSIYLAIGVLVGSCGNLSKLNQFKTSTLLLLTICGYLAVVLGVKLNLTEEKLLSPIVAILGISSTVVLAIILKRFDRAKFIEEWGKLSLQIYVVHTLASAGVRILLQQLFGFTEPLIHLLLGTAIGIYAPIALNMICKKIKFKYMFTFP
ncbi:MAG: acyltransferase [Microcoleaceae cyanobacterium]